MISPGLIAAARVLPDDGPAFTPHRYWRVLNVQTQVPNSNISSSRIEFHESYWGPNVVTGGTPIDTGTPFAAGLDAAQSFDEDWSTRTVYSSLQQASGPGYDFGAGNEKSICSFGLAARESPWHTETPVAMKLQWSDDGTTWFDLFDVTTSNWTPMEYRRFRHPDLSNAHVAGSPHGDHAVWRMDSITNGSPNVGLSEIQFRPTPGVSAPSTGGTPAALTTLSTFVAANAFDSDPSSIYVAASNNFQWLRYLHPVARECGQFMLQARPSFQADAPQRFQVLYADSVGGPWTIAWQGDFGGSWAAGEIRTSTDPAYI